MRAAVLVSMLALAGCYSPDITSGQFLCMKGECPSGFVCDACSNKCVSADKVTTCDAGVPTDFSATADLAGVDLTAAQDLAVAQDLAAVSTTGCSNGNGQRIPMGDPGLKDIGFCAAAWLVPGTSTATSMTTPCNRQPGMDGMSGATKCTVEDNCAAGWHVCRNETELAQKGLVRSSCDGPAPPTGSGPFFVTREGNSPVASEMAMTPGCNNAQINPGPVLGCGSAGVATAGCTLISHALVNPPGKSDNCFDATGGTFSCAGANMTSPESALLVKTTLMGGGVLCCRD